MSICPSSPKSILVMSARVGYDRRSCLAGGLRGSKPRPFTHQYKAVGLLVVEFDGFVKACPGGGDPILLTGLRCNHYR